MSRSQQQIAAFSSGEVTPALAGRSDTEEYPYFLKKLENCYVEKHGGVKGRGGLQYVNDARDRNVRLVPFVFSREQSYVLEFGNKYIRFFRNDGYVENVDDVQTYLGNGTEVKFQYPYAVPSSEVYVYFYLTDPDDGKKKFINIADTEFTLTAIDTVNNLLADFNDTDWDGDATTIGTPWVLPNDGTATSPLLASPILREATINLTHGSHIDLKVEIDSTFFDSDNLNASVGSTTLIGETFSEILNITATKDYQQAIISFDVRFEATLPSVSDIVSARLERGNPTDGWTSLIEFSQSVDNGGVVFSSPDIQYFDVKNGEQFRIIARQSDTNAAVIQVPDTPASSIDGNMIVDPNARLHFSVQDGGGGTNATSIALRDITAPFTWNLIQDNVLDSPAPLQASFFVDPGGQVTLSGIEAKNIHDGWDIEFTEAPAVGTSILITTVAPTLVNATEVFPESVEPKLNPLANAPEPFEIESPFVTEDLIDIYWAQANDVLFICHHKYAPYRLTRLDSYNWALDQPTFHGAVWDVPATSHSAKGKASATAVEPLVKEFPFYFDVNAKVDMQVYFNGILQDAALWDISTGETFPVTDADSEITFTKAPTVGTVVRISHTVSDYDPADGYPRSVAFFQERLTFTATLAKPQTMWMSRAADFYDFYVPNTQKNQTLTPDAALEYTIAAHTHEAIEWLSSERILVIGTSATEHRLAPDEYLATDRLPKVSKMTDYGGSHQIPMYMGNMTCFIQQSGHQLRSFQQRSDSVIEDYESIDLTWMCQHMVEDLWIKEPYYALIPHNIAVMVREDGQLMTAMYDPSNGSMKAQDMGWSRHITDGKFKSCCVIPTDFGNQIWVAVEREVNGETKTYIEFFNDEFYMDSALFTEAGSAPTNVLTGLGHLEGKELQILVDGALHPPQTVVNGEINLLWEGIDIVAGIGFHNALETMPFTQGNPSGTGKGKPGRWNEIWVQLIESAHPLINGKRPPVRYPSTPMTTAQPPINGDVRAFDTGFSRDKPITVEQDLPLPFHIVTIYGNFHVGAG